MKKWLIFEGVVLGVLAMVVASYLIFKVAPTETRIQSIEKENVRLRVIAENYELKYKIQVIEEKLRARAKTKVNPVPSGAKVDIKSK